MAAADEQALRLLIAANTELARKELDKLDASLKNTSENADGTSDQVKKSFADMGSAADAAKGFVVGFLASLSIEAVAGFGRAILDFADNLDAAAEKAGLSVERYQTLQEGLRSLEVDAEKVDQIFGRLQDTLGAVQSGTAAAGTVEVLDKMGITARILNGEITNTGQFLDAIAGSAKKFNTEAEFTAAVVDLVGRKVGIDLANALKDGGAELKAQEQRFRETGAVIDGELITKLADANEAIDQFASKTKARLAIWAAGVIPSLNIVGQAFAGIARIYENEGLVAALFSSDEKRYQAGTNAGYKALLERRVKEAEASLKEAEALRRAGGALNELKGGSIPEIGARQGKLRAARALLAEFNDKNLNARFPVPTFSDGVGTSVVDAPEIVVTAGRQRAGGRAGSRAATRAQPRQLTPAEIRAGFGDKKPGDVAQLGPSLINQGPLIDLASIQTGPLDDLIAQLPELTKEFDAADAAALDFSRNLTAGFAAAIVRGDSLEDVVAGLGQRFAELALNSVFDALIGGALNSLFGGIFGGIGGSIFGGAFAAGGSPPVGKVSLVGERGPELFVPRVPGTIIPNDKIGLGGGGGTVVQNFDLRGTIMTEQLYRDIEARGQQAARDGAMGGRLLADGDQKRARRRKLRG